MAKVRQRKPAVLFMKIEGTGAARGNAAKRAGRADTRQGEVFANTLVGAAESHEAAVAAPAPTSGVGALLAVQEVGDALSSRSQARKRAQARADAMLDKLDEIRVGLLTGALSKAALTELARLVESRREMVDDPHLAAVLDEIDLRAQVELAKISYQR